MNRCKYCSKTFPHAPLYVQHECSSAPADELQQRIGTQAEDRVKQTGEEKGASASLKRKNASNDALVRKRCRLDDGNLKSKEPMAGMKASGEGSGDGRAGGVGAGTGERCLLDLLLFAAEKERGVAAESSRPPPPPPPPPPSSDADLVDGKKQENQSGVAIVRQKPALDTHVSEEKAVVSMQPFLPGRRIEGGDDDWKGGGSEEKTSKTSAMEAGNVNLIKKVKQVHFSTVNVFSCSLGDILSPVHCT